MQKKSALNLIGKELRKTLYILHIFNGILMAFRIQDYFIKLLSLIMFSIWATVRTSGPYRVRYC